jgi:hypothetical protein
MISWKKLKRKLKQPKKKSVNMSETTEHKAHIFKPLLDEAEELRKVSFKLIKLKFIDKTAHVSSTLLSRLLIAFVIFFFVLTLSFCIALWLGDLLGKNYYGFLLVAIFYGLIAVILLFMLPYVKNRINDHIIKRSIVHL